MAIPMEDFRNPYFIKYREGHTLTRDTKDRYLSYDAAYTRHFRGIPQLGYDASNPSTHISRVRFDTENVNLRSR